MKPVELNDAVSRIQWLLSAEAVRMFPDTTRLEQLEICLGPIIAYFEDHDFGEWKIRNARVMSAGEMVRCKTETAN